MLKLQWPQNPNPIWHAAGHTVHIGLALHNGMVQAEGDVLSVLEGSLPSAGTRMIILKNAGHLIAESEPDYDLRMEQLRKSRNEATRNRDEAANTRLAKRSAHKKLAAQQFNAKIAVPVRWTAGVSAGLPETQICTAYGIVHVLLLEAVREGRLEREPHSLLCTGGGDQESVEESPAEQAPRAVQMDGPDGAYVPKVTCRRCVRIAQRWANYQGTRFDPELTSPGAPNSIS